MRTNCNRGELLTATELQEIAENYILTEHAKNRLPERYPHLNISKAILYPVIVYFNTDYTINIALNGYEYIVVGHNQNCYTVITVKEKSLNGIDIFAKRDFAVNGYGRRKHKYHM